MSRRYKYIGGKVRVVEVTEGKIYQSYLDEDGEVHIVDDFWLRLNYTADMMLFENNYCYVNIYELNNCFVEV